MEWLAHLKGIGVNILNEKTKIPVDTALVNQVKVFIAAFQGRDNCINDCYILAKYNAIVNVREYNNILSKEDAFINLTLNESKSNESFA
jgi:hypothetical protein